jgi:hypothetical protein
MAEFVAAPMIPKLSRCVRVDLRYSCGAYYRWMRACGFTRRYALRVAAWRCSWS